MTESSIWNWENNESQPALRFLPAVIQFLGYNPLPEGESLIEKFTSLRKSLGLTHELVAERLGVDESTIADWEQHRTTPNGPCRKLIQRFMETGGFFNAGAEQSDNFSFSPPLLIAARQRMGLSRAALARRLEISVHTLWRWERGDRKPTGGYWTLLAAIIRNRD